MKSLIGVAIALCLWWHGRPVNAASDLWRIATTTETRVVEVSLEVHDWVAAPPAAQIFEALRQADSLLASQRTLANDTQVLSEDSKLLSWLQSLAEGFAETGAAAAELAFGKSGTRLFRSDLLRRSLDALYSNGWYLAPCVYASNVAAAERHLAILVSGMSCHEPEWISTYWLDETSNVTGVEYECGINRTRASARGVKRFSTDLRRFARAGHGGVTIGRATDARSVSILHRCLDSPKAAGRALEHLKEVTAADRMMVFHSDCSQQPHGAQPLGSWVASATLKNPEYKTLNEAQSTEDDIAANKLNLRQKPDAETLLSTDKADLVATRHNSLAELVQDKKAMASLGWTSVNHLLSTIKAALQSNITCFGIPPGTTPSEVKLQCLAAQVQAIPALLPEISGSVEEQAKLRKALTSLHAVVDPRWNALLVNGDIVGHSSSSAVMSRSLHHGYLFEIINHVLLPVAVEHEVMRKAGLADHLISRSLLGVASKVAAPREDSRALFADLAIRLATVSANGSLGSFSGQGRLRWDYRTFDGPEILLADPVTSDIRDKKDHGEEVESEDDEHISKRTRPRDGRLTPREFLARLPQLLMRRGALDQAKLSFTLADIRFIMDPDNEAHWALAKEIASRFEERGAQVRLMLTRARTSQGASAAAAILDPKAGRADTQALVADFAVGRSPKKTSQSGSNRAVQHFDSVERSLIPAPAISLNGRIVLLGKNLIAGVGGEPEDTENHATQSQYREALRLLEAVWQEDQQQLLINMLGLLSPMFESASRNPVMAAVRSPAGAAALFEAQGQGRWISQVLRDSFSATTQRYGIKDAEYVDFYMDRQRQQPSVDDFFLTDSVAAFHESPWTDMVDARSDVVVTDRGGTPLVDAMLRLPTEVFSAGKSLAEPDQPAAPHHIVVYLLPIGTVEPTPLSRRWLDAHQFAVSVDADSRVFLTRTTCMNAPGVGVWVDGMFVELPANATTAEHLAVAEHLVQVVESIQASHWHSCSAKERVQNKWDPYCLEAFALTAPADLAPGARAQWMHNHLLHALQADSGNENLAQIQRLFHRGALRPLRLTAEKEDLDSPVFIQAVVDPLSRWAQYIVPILAYLHTYLDVRVQLVLNPGSTYKELPVNSWRTSMLIPPSSGLPLPEHPKSKFYAIDANETLTLALEAPSNWHVMTQEAEVDLDNLITSKLPVNSFTASYALTGLYIEGGIRGFELAPTAPDHFDEITAGKAVGFSSLEPSTDFIGGNTLVLTSADIEANESVICDTTTMRSPAYFQFEVPCPGSYRLALVNKEIVSHRKTSRDPAAPSVRSTHQVRLAESIGGLEIATVPAVTTEVTSFKQPMMYLELFGYTTASEMVEAHGLDEDDSLADRVKSAWSSWWKGGDKAIVPVTPVGRGDRVHIFTLATGHMYERLMRIMMLSVIKHTQRPVTFWILENFLSAKFKAKMRRMMDKYSQLSVEYVSYKWPPFLRPQTEKQRQIWAYKILFLDVVFPVSLHQVIYVDADQIVRGDIGELWDLDMKGRVYGFTPFCHDRKETAQFRFWDQGYWLEHLEGRPYHISALFKVDLDLFRSRQVGPDLRSIYNTLSADPESLANLDQDLPNFAQRTIPIFSLPQEWLWCETWCSDAIKHKAKTIDLCNNPLTHEPKLSQARRIVSEWTTYDKELQEVIEEEAFDDTGVSAVIRKDEL